MYLETVDHFAAVAVQKRAFLARTPLGFWLSSMMAGAYVGLGIILIFSIGADVDPAYRALIMGTSFGVALTLVIFAGSDLFTGHTMFMPLGLLRGRASLADVGACWTLSWLGNLAGCAVLAALFVMGGGGAALHAKSNLLMTVAAAKMNAPALALLARAILCNWLVCLAIWMSARMSGDAARCIAIFWCLFAFIGSGYEHSVANMTLLLIALLHDYPGSAQWGEAITWGGLAHNLFWVTLGNMIAGAGIMAAGYWTMARPTAAQPALGQLAREPAE
jgi:nitrite transporter